MNFELGLKCLEHFVTPDDTEHWDDFQLARTQLLANLQNERRFGGTSSLSHERAQIVFKPALGNAPTVCTTAPVYVFHTRIDLPYLSPRPPQAQLQEWMEHARLTTG
jgi:hypothetical protein